MKPFYVTFDAFPELRDNQTGWTMMSAPFSDDGFIGAHRESPFAVEDHELGYIAFDDDGNLCAAGTCTERHSSKDWQHNGLEGSYLADQHHMNDSGAVHTFFYRRDTSVWLGQVYG